MPTSSKPMSQRLKPTIIIVLGLILIFYYRMHITEYLVSKNNERIARSLEFLNSDRKEEKDSSISQLGAPRVGEVTFNDKAPSMDHPKTENLAQKLESALHPDSSSNSGNKNDDRLKYFYKIIDQAELDPTSINAKELTWQGYNKEQKLKLPQKIIDKIDFKAINKVKLEYMPKVGEILKETFGSENVTEILMGL